MHASFRRSLALALAAAVTFAAAAASAGGSVHVALTAQRVTLVDGHETLAPADKARPGDVLEYRAVYANDGATAARELFATLPIPPGLEYLPRTATPAGVQASLDGHAFAPAPLMRTARTADGREVLREVPASEYRALRWSLGTLAAKDTRTVVARARVTPLQAAALAR